MRPPRGTLNIWLDGPAAGMFPALDHSLPPDVVVGGRRRTRVPVQHSACMRIKVGVHRAESATGESMNDLSVTNKVRAVQLVGVASGCGARDTGCEAGADALRTMQLAARLRAHGVRARWTDVIRPVAAYRADSLKAVRKICVRLAKRVERIVHEGDLPIVVGGDHTSAIGTWKGVA